MADWGFKISLLGAALGLVLLLLGSRAASGVDQGDFVDELQIGSLPLATTLEWLPSGDPLILGQGGQIVIGDLDNGNFSTHFTIPNVDSSGERGALDIVLDPDFDSNNYFYVYYSSPSGSGDAELRIDRFTYTGNSSADAASRTPIWENPGPDHEEPYHIGGSLNIDTSDNNNFYLSIGDGFDASNSQDLSNVFGKILRIRPNGTAPGSNPFHQGNGDPEDFIWAYGVRNPFRASIDEPTGRYIFGDVGGNVAPNAWEEINIGVEGANYGWATCEGYVTNACANGTQGPAFAYPHDPNGGCCTNASITGGEVFRSNQLPSELDEAYIYADFGFEEIRYVTFANNGSVNDDGVIKSISRRPVWVGASPTGEIYYLGYTSGFESQLRRVRYTEIPDQPPTILEASADPVSGGAPLTVDFTGLAEDANLDPISYRWEFGDGTTSNQQNPSHDYDDVGTYEARLRVQAGGDTAFSDFITITVGTPPDVTIDTPSNGATFVAGDTINLTGSATGDGPLSYSWTGVFVHDQHTHPTTVLDAPGASINFAVPTASGHDYQGDTSYLFTLTVTDVNGLSTSESVEIEPVIHDLTVATSPANGLVSIGGVQHQSPITVNALEGFQTEIAAPDTGCFSDSLYSFASWSDGGAREHTIALTSPSTLTASYALQGAGCDPTSTVVFPTHNQDIADSAIDITGTASAGPSVAAVEILIRSVDTSLWWNGSSWQSNKETLFADLDSPGSASTTWTYSFAPPDLGETRVRANARSSDGELEAEINWTRFTLIEGNQNDSQKPDATITSPGSTSTTPMTIAGGATDNVEVSQVQLTIRDTNGGDYWTGTGWGNKTNLDATITSGAGTGNVTWEYDFDPPNDSKFKIRAWATDPTGNTSSKAKLTTESSGGGGGPDTEDPDTTITSPGSTSTTPMTIAGGATDNVEVDRVRLTIRDTNTGDYWTGNGWGNKTNLDATITSGAGTGTVTWDYFFDPPNDSKFKIRAFATDTSDNTGSKARQTTRTD